MAIATVTSPIVNMNGTSRGILLGGYARAMESLRRARKELAEIAPHGRDYPGDDARYLSAKTEHMERLTGVGQMIEDLERIAMKVRA